MTKNFSHANHFTHPLLIAFILQSLLQTYRFNGYLIARVREILDLKIIAKSDENMSLKNLSHDECNFLRNWTQNITEV